MAILEYGIGGNEVRIDASEAIADIPENRTLLIEQLTAEEPVNPEVTTGLTTVEEVFAHYKPQMDVEFENAEGQPVKETFQFSNVGDFNIKNMTQQSPFLDKLSSDLEFHENLSRQLRSNKVLQRALQNPEARQAFASVLEALREELLAADNNNE